MSRIFFVQLVLILSLANCSRPSIQTVPTLTQEPRLLKTPEPTPTITDTFTPKITLTPVFTSQIFYPTPTFTISPPIIIPPESHLKIQCIEVSDGSMQEDVITGTLVLNGNNASNSILLDLKTGIKTEIYKESGETMSLIVVSPDRKWLAYTKWINNNQGWLVVSKKDGKPYKTIPMENDWGAYIIGWLDNEHLILASRRNLLSPTYIILDPFTRETKELFTDYPNIEKVPNGADWWGPVVYDPLLTRAVYPRTEGDETNSKRIVLWDLQANQAVTYLTSRNNPYGGPPVWTPDGQQFAMTLEEIPRINTLADELYSITRDGQLTQITNLKAYYSVLMKIVHYSWSPNKQRIAFWIEYGWQNYLDYQQLAVLNLKTQQVTNYCISGMMSAHEPNWSPDGRYLVVEGNPGKNVNTHNVILVDLLKINAIQIGENLRPVGWMI